MKQKLLWVLLSGLLFNLPLYGSHVQGNVFSYECLGGNSYLVRSTIYTECNFVYFPFYPMGSGNFPPIDTASMSLSFNSIGCTGGSITPVGNWTPISWTEVSLLCPNVMSSCEDVNSTLYGSGQITVERTYNIIQGNCGNPTLSYLACCRTSLHTNGTGNQGIYNEMEINLGQGACDNSSPQFLHAPPLYICNGDTVSFDMTAFDPDGDSIAYYLEPVLETNGNPVTYSQGYSAVSPFGPQWSISIDPKSGRFTVASTNASPESSAIVVVAEEFRAGGSIGKTRADFPLIGVDCMSNAAPSPSPVQVIGGGVALGPDAIRVFEGVPNTFAVTFTDSTSDSLSVVNDFIQRLPNASLSVTGVNPLAVTVTWTPDSTVVGRSFYAGPQVIDDVCPLPSTFYQPIRFEVFEFGASALITDSDCQVNNGAIDMTVTGQAGPYSFQWSNGATTEDIANLGPGTYTITITGASGIAVTESFIVEAGNILANISTTNPNCGLADGSMAALPTGGTAPYTYVWNTGATSNSLSGLAEGGYSVVIQDANGCYEVESLLLEEPDSCTIRISGTVYLDANQNCVQDSGETGTPNVLVLTNTGFGAMTDLQGNYVIEIDTGVSILTAYPPNQPSNCNNAPYNVFFPTTGIDTTGVDFPWFIQPVLDLGAFVAGPHIRSGFPNQTGTVVYNAGNTIRNGTVDFTYDSALCVQSVSPPPAIHDTANHFISWNFSGLYGNSFTYFDVWYKPDSTLVIGDYLYFNTLVKPLAGDIDTLNNYGPKARTIYGPFDPNIKEVNPAGIREAGYITASQEVRTYTINFQNLGNYPAKNVLIRDTLDTDLDLTSIQAEASSHAYALTIRPGRILEFYFKDINLPDSISDPVGSNGYVSFRVSHNPALPVGTVITNRAGIYFDFNAPIVTNLVSNTIYAQPEITLPRDTSGYCEGDELEASLISQGMEPYTYTWSSGKVDDNVIKLNSTDSVSSSGWYVIEVEDAFGFTAIDSVEVEVRPLPSADVSWQRDMSTGITFNAGAVEADSYEWTFSNGITSTNAQPSVDIMGLDSLEYTLVLTNTCGSSTYAERIVLVNNLDLSIIGGVKVFPQPARDFVKIHWDLALPNTMIQLYSFDGKLMRTVKADLLNEVNISTNDLASGLYLYQIKVEEKMVYGGKFMVE
ncbi:MAG: T9SS type A sorting domain-containing protein [Bacteroidota bacterium]